MSTPTRPPDDDLPRDPAFDDAWRALSREEPSAALDAAVRAAARREVGAGPQPVATRASPGASAATPMNWWRPLAVAATLGAIAVGLLQLVMPEHVGAPSRDGAIVSDMPAADALRQTESAKKQAAATASNEIVAPEEKARAPSPPATPAGSAVDRKEAQLQSREPGAPHDEFAQRNARKDVTAERKRDAAPSGAPDSVAPAMLAQKRGVESANAPPPQPAPARAAEPFPAEQAKREAATPAREATAETASARAPAAAPAPAAAGGAVAGAPAAPTDKALAGKPAADSGAASLAKLKTAPAPVASEGTLSASPGQGRREQDMQPPPRFTASMQEVAPASALDARVAEHAPLPVPDWIALIRRLIAEKNYATAEKELAAFRAAHPDADRMLPQDLRDWKTPH